MTLCHNIRTQIASKCHDITMSAHFLGSAFNHFNKKVTSRYYHVMMTSCHDDSYIKLYVICARWYLVTRRQYPAGSMIMEGASVLTLVVDEPKTFTMTMSFRLVLSITRKNRASNPDDTINPTAPSWRSI